jgi:hypothetical protein
VPTPARSDNTPWRDRLSHLFAALLRRTDEPSAREVLGMGLVLVVVGLIAYGAYVAHGGFYSDDWSNAADYRFSAPPKYWTSVGNLEDVIGGRPLAALLIPIPHALFGTHPELHLGLAVALGIAVSLSLYLMLRMLSLAALHAGAIAILALLFPWSDVIRLWSVAGVLSLSVGFLFGGMAMALGGLKRHDRAAIAMHAGADALYLFSVLTYEATAGVAMLAGFLYLGRTSLRGAARRWLADIVVVLAALSYSLATTVNSRHVGSIAERFDDVGEFAHQAALLLVSALVPVGSSNRPVVQGLVLLLVVVIIGVALLRWRQTSEGDLHDWIGLIAAAGVAIAAAYFMFLGSNLHPRDPGIDMRTNILAGTVYCVLAYGIVATGSLLLLRSRPAAAALTVAAALAIAVGYGVRLHDDETTWRRAATLQDEVLSAVDSRLQPLPRASTVVTFGFPAQAGPEVPIFDKSWDLHSAVQLQGGDSTLRAYPVYEGVAVRCGPNTVVVDGRGNYGTFRVDYGRVYFLNISPDRGRRIRTPLACANALRDFHPGPRRA